MPNVFAHFAIEADDVDRALQFYKSVFGWSFEPWGPPDFYLINGAGVHGALQKRSAPHGTGRKGFHCSFAVSDIAVSKQLVEEAGGTIEGSEITIPTVGTLVEFIDTEGNEATLMQYDPARATELGLG